MCLASPNYEKHMVIRNASGEGLERSVRVWRVALDACLVRLDPIFGRYAESTIMSVASRRSGQKHHRAAVINFLLVKPGAVKFTKIAEKNRQIGSLFSQKLNRMQVSS